MIFESISNKKGNQELTELFIGVMKINISTFLSHSFFNNTKRARLNSTHFLL